MLNCAHTWSEQDLFILADEQLIEQSDNAVRRLCPIEKRPEPVIVPSEPWEGFGSDGRVTSLQDPFYGVVLRDPEDDVFRCWYNAYDRTVNRQNLPPFADQGSSCCLAISTDGLEWEKFPLRRVMHNGSLENNIIRFAQQATPDTSVLAEQAWNVIPYSAPDSEDRYAATLYTQYDDPIYPKGITMCFSPNGVDWRAQFPPVLPLDGDCHSLSADPAGKGYVLTSRSHQHGRLCKRWGRPWKRHIALSRSRDLIHWTAMETVLEADEQDSEDTQLYLMYIIPYGHAYLGQLLVMRTDDMTLEEQLVLSRDLHQWQRVGDRRPILVRGPEGSWDSKHVALTNNIPHPEGDKIRFWYAGKNTPHYQAGYGALGTGMLRRDGFVCWEASGKEGVITSLPFKPTGASWFLLNVDASEGEVLTEVTDLDGNPIEGCTRADCVPITGDHTRAVVNFKADPTRFFDRGNFMRFGRTVRLRFYLRDAKLYAFKARNLEPQWPSQE